MATRMSQVKRRRPPAIVKSIPISSVSPDPKNPRRESPDRMALLKLSLRKCGFLQPVMITSEGMLMSGHQRCKVAGVLDFKTVPAVVVDLTEEQLRGFNMVANRVCNDFGSFDTGSKAAARLDVGSIIEAAEALPDFEGEAWYALDCKIEPLAPLVSGQAAKYDKKATSMAFIPYRMGVKIPVVASMSGQIVNGIHRAFAALEAGETTWPVIRIPDTHAGVASNFLNGISMDFEVTKEFERLLRASAYRRPQNQRGTLSKSYRFWANGKKSLQDRDSYSADYWRTFRDLHGSVLDFGGGLCTAAPYLRTKGIDAIDFEPYLIDPASDSGMPSLTYSRQQAKRFLAEISDPKKKFDSIFLSSVLNSIPFDSDRRKVLAIVHALCSRTTVVYGTCRDISDHEYQYSGMRNAAVFTFDSEPGVRLGDLNHRPKAQKFHTHEEAHALLSLFWKSVELYPANNVFHWCASAPIGLNPGVLAKSLEFEFDLPFRCGSNLNLVREAKKSFSSRLLIKIV